MTYKDGELLLRSLKNLQSGRDFLKPALQIIVVDVESTLSVEERRRLQVLSESLSIEVIESKVNHLSINRNRALARAEAPWILFLDADAEISVSSLNQIFEEALDGSKREADFSGLGGVNRPPLEESFFFDVQRAFQKIFFGHIRSPQMWIPKSTTQVRYLSTVFALFRKSDLQEVGNFDSAFPSVCEDQDLGLRLSAAGKKLYLSPKAEVIHRSESRWSQWFYRVFRFGRGQGPVLLKHPQGWRGFRAAILLAPLFLGALGVLEPTLWGIYFLAYASLLILGTGFHALRGDFTGRVAWVLPTFSFLNHVIYAGAFYLGLLEALVKAFAPKRQLSEEVVGEVL